MDGGPNYLQQFAFPLAADRFPIGVWLECAVDPQAVATDHGAGLDIYTALCANQAELANARNGGMRVLFQDEWLGRMPTDAVNAGYMVGDEWDMTRGPTACLNGDWQDQINRFPNDGRVKYANFGKGVNFWETNAEAACWVNSVDLPSTDEYWFSDNNVCGSSEGGGKPGVITANNCHVAANYGWNVQRVRNLVSPLGSKATWSFVEDGCPFGDSGWPCIQTQQIRPAVWHSLIAGAQGIVYFNHSFKAGAGNGACAGSFHTLRDCAPFGSLLRRSMRRSSRSREYFVRLRWQAGSAPTRTYGREPSGTARTSTSWPERQGTLGRSRDCSGSPASATPRRRSSENLAAFR